MSERVKKVGLSNFDNKRYILPKGALPRVRAHWPHQGQVHAVKTSRFQQEWEVG